VDDDIASVVLKVGFTNTYWLNEPGPENHTQPPKIGTTRIASQTFTFL
jgi:hypothetical protein